MGGGLTAGVPPGPSAGLRPPGPEPARPAVTGPAVGCAAAAAQLLRPCRPRGRARAAGLRAPPSDPGRRRRGAGDRDGGLRRNGGRRLARVPRPHRPHRRHVRPAGTRVRVLHLRHVLLREPGLPARGHRVGGAAAGRPGDRGRGAGRQAPDGRIPGNSGIPGGCGIPGERARPGECGRPGQRDRAGRARTPIAARDLARGPARLCQALGIDRGLDGADVCDRGSPLRVSGPVLAVTAADIRQGPRVGVSRAAAVPWRFWIAGDPTVSAYRAYAPRRAAKAGSAPPHDGGTMQR